MIIGRRILDSLTFIGFSLQSLMLSSDGTNHDTNQNPLVIEGYVISDIQQ